MKIDEMKMIKLGEQLAEIAKEWSTWTPTITWLTATPAGVVTKARYKLIGKTVHFLMLITATDGNNSAGISFTLPIAPKDNNIEPAMQIQQVVGSTIGIRYANIRDNGVNNDVVTNVSTATSGQVLKYRIWGSYEIA